MGVNGFVANRKMAGRSLAGSQSRTSQRFKDRWCVWVVLVLVLTMVGLCFVCRVFILTTVSL